MMALLYLRSAKRRGFTLIELIIVIAILAIIAALAIPAYSNLQRETRLRVAAANMDTLERAYAVSKELAALDGAVQTEDQIIINGISGNQDPYDNAVKKAMDGLIGDTGMSYTLMELTSSDILIITYRKDGWEYTRDAAGEITEKKL